MFPVGPENDHCRDHFRPMSGQSRSVVAQPESNLKVKIAFHSYFLRSHKKFKFACATVQTRLQIEVKAHPTVLAL